MPILNIEAERERIAGGYLNPPQPQRTALANLGFQQIKEGLAELAKLGHLYVLSTPDAVPTPEPEKVMPDLSIEGGQKLVAPTQPPASPHLSPEHPAQASIDKELEAKAMAEAANNQASQK